MKIAYLISCYPAVSHTFILREIAELGRCGIEVQTASINESNIQPLYGEEKREAERTFYVKEAGIAKALLAVLKMVAFHPLRFFQTLFYAILLAKWDLKKQAKMLAYFAESALVGVWMERNSLTHLHIHFANAASTVGLLTSKLIGVPFSITVHGPDAFYDIEGLYLPEKVKAAKFVVTISSYGRSQICRLLPFPLWKKVKVCHLGVDPEQFVPKKGGGNKTFEILCVGRLVPAKGQHVLLLALKRLLEERRGVLVRMVGTGPDHKSLVRNAEDMGLSDSIVFEGAAGQEQVRYFLDGADLFVLPSFAEGLPVVLMEAMAAGVPCVTTAITGIGELIRDGVEGKLVFAADDRLLAEAIALMMDNPDMYDRLAKAGRQRVEEKFDLKKNVRRLAEVFVKEL